VLAGSLVWAAHGESGEKSSVASFRRLLHHALWRPPARTARAEVAVDGSGLELGDVIVASDPESDYGYFSHVTAVIGPGDTIGHHIAYGIFVRPIGELTGYDDVRVLRADLSPGRRAEVTRFLRSLLGGKFNLLAHTRDARSWNCAKSIWQAYARVGIDLAPGRAFVTPDDIASSARLHQVAAWRPK
jgi:uncharacterized protein YycO